MLWDDIICPIIPNDYPRLLMDYTFELSKKRGALTSLKLKDKYTVAFCRFHIVK